METLYWATFDFTVDFNKKKPLKIENFVVNGFFLIKIKENRNLKLELANMREELDTRNNEINNLHTLIDKIQDDKSKLAKKISKLLDNGNNFIKLIIFFQKFKNFSKFVTKKFNRF